MVGLMRTGRFTTGVVQAMARAAWELGRANGWFTRRFGWPGWLLVLSAGAAVTAGVVERQQLRAAIDAQSRMASVPQMSMPPVPAARIDRVSGLSAFESALPDHAQIPAVVQDLLKLAEAQGLTIARGEYKAELNTLGGFLGYRMTLPVRGDAQAIHRFMQAALRAHRTLALDAVQFKREQIASAEIEARIQWMLLTRPPARGDATAARTSPRGAP